MAELLMTNEIRAIAADDLWLSYAYGSDGMVAFHFTFVDDFGAVSQLLPLMEAALRPFGGRPHMGKVFTMAPARVQEAGFDADSLTRFRDLVKRYDPDGCFTNKFVETYVLGDGGDETVAELHH